MHPPKDWTEAYDRIRTHLGTGEPHATRPIDLHELGLIAGSSATTKALAFLSSEGLIVTRHGKHYPARKPARSLRRTSFFSDYRRAGRIPSLQTLDLQIVPVEQLDTELISLFELSNTQLVVRHHHLQRIDNVPYAVADSYLPHDLFGILFPRLENATVDLYRMMAEAGYKPTRKRETLFVDVPTSEERKWLALDGLDRVMVVRLNGVVWSNDRIVEVCRLCDRADLYEFTYEVGIVEPTC